MRFFYYYPTYDKPSGGNKQIRLQASLLRELGVETYLLRDESFLTRPNSFDDNTFYKVPVDIAPVPFERAGEYLTEDDVLILPEVRLSEWFSKCANWRVRIAVNNQNGFHGLRYGLRRSVARARIEFAIANAPYVASLCHHFYGLSWQRIFLVPHWIVRPPFEIDVALTPKNLAICYMPRKMSNLVEQIQRRVQCKYPDVPWVSIDGVPELEVARLLRANKIFFAAQEREGCPLTALEAMACNAVVAGYPGTGGFPHPYASPDNGFWARDNDVETAVSALGRAINVVRHGGQEYQKILEAGRATARRFSREAVLRALTDMVETVGQRGYHRRKVQRYKLGIRGWWQAGRTLYDADRLGLIGRVASMFMRTIKRARSFVTGEGLSLNSGNQKPLSLSADVKNEPGSQCLLSVICCTYNREHFVRAHFEAIIGQITEDMELIYALDHCTDGTYGFLVERARGLRNVRIIHNSGKKGVYHCRNYAVSQARGEYIHFFENDNLVSENFYKEIVAFLKRDNSYDLIVTSLKREEKGVVSDFEVRMNKEKLDGYARTADGIQIVGENVLEDLIRYNVFIEELNSIRRKDICAKTPYRQQKYDRWSDCIFLVEAALKHGLKIMILDKPIYGIYRFHEDSMISIVKDRIIFDKYSAFRHLGALLRKKPELRRVNAERADVCLCQMAEIYKNTNIPKSLYYYAYYYLRRLIQKVIFIFNGR